MKEFAPIVEMCLLLVYDQKPDAIKTICSCSIPSHVMLVEYGKLKYKLEDMPVDEKKELWDYAYQLFPTKTSQERLNVCKIIHTIGTLI